MNVDDFLDNDFANQSFEINQPKLLLILLQEIVATKIIVNSMVRKQFEIGELIKGETEINEKVLQKLDDFDTSLHQLISKNYYELLQKVIVS